jgi:hypothetical protein
MRKFLSDRIKIETAQEQSEEKCERYSGAKFAERDRELESLSSLRNELFYRSGDVARPSID